MTKQTTMRLDICKALVDLPMPFTNVRLPPGNRLNASCAGPVADHMKSGLQMPASQ